MPKPPHVVSVSRDNQHRFSKPPVASIVLVEGRGVEGDVHAGVTAQHRHVKKTDPTRLNLTQVHLMPSELFAELAVQGFDVGPGQLGENITTSGIDLITLPLGTRLHLGEHAVVEVTGLRSPCNLINGFQDGLMKACIAKDEDGRVIRKSGVMSVVVTGGLIEPGAQIRVVLPADPHQPLGVV